MALPLGSGAEAPFNGTAAPVPGTVQGENYDTGGAGVGYNVNSANGTANSYRGDGVDLEMTMDTGGGYDLGWTAAGQWFRYTVNVATAGTYTVSFRVAAPSAVTGAFHLSNASGQNLTGAVNAPATGNFQAWTTVTANVTLPAGQQTLTLNEDNGGWNINNLSFTTSGGGTEAPFNGTAAPVPGTVQGENYDTGGAGVGYNVNSANGTANSYRGDGVDLEMTMDTGGGYDLGWTAAGQWFRYTVNVATAGTYTVSFRVAAPSAVTGAFHLSNASGQNLTGAVNIPATGNFQNWTTVTANVTLPAGQQTLTLNEDNGGWNVNYLSFTTSGGGTISSSAWYEVINQNSNSCVDDAGASTANGTAVQQWTCGGAANQQWQFQPTGGGYYSVLNRNAATQNEVWDISGGPSATSPGIGIQTWSNGGGTNQQWQPVSLGGGYYKFVALNDGLCLDVPGASTANGVQLQQNTCNGATEQGFRLLQQ